MVADMLYCNDLAVSFYVAALRTQSFVEHWRFVEGRGIPEPSLIINRY